MRKSQVCGSSRCKRERLYHFRAKKKGNAKPLWNHLVPIVLIRFTERKRNTCSAERSFPSSTEFLRMVHPLVTFWTISMACGSVDIRFYYFFFPLEKKERKIDKWAMNWFHLITPGIFSWLRFHSLAVCRRLWRSFRHILRDISTWTRLRVPFSESLRRFIPTERAAEEKKKKTPTFAFFIRSTHLPHLIAR